MKTTVTGCLTLSWIAVIKQTLASVGKEAALWTSAVMRLYLLDGKGSVRTNTTVNFRKISPETGEVLIAVSALASPPTSPPCH